MTYRKDWHAFAGFLMILQAAKLDPVSRSPAADPAAGPAADPAAGPAAKLQG